LWVDAVSSAPHGPAFQLQMRWQRHLATGKLLLLLEKRTPHHVVHLFLADGVLAESTASQQCCNELISQWRRLQVEHSGSQVAHKCCKFRQHGGVRDGDSPSQKWRPDSTMSLLPAAPLLPRAVHAPFAVLACAGWPPSSQDFAA
jgi:hypothetical protein